MNFNNYAIIKSNNRAACCFYVRLNKFMNGKRRKVGRILKLIFRLDWYFAGRRTSSFNSHSRAPFIFTGMRLPFLLFSRLSSCLPNFAAATQLLAARRLPRQTSRRRSLAAVSLYVATLAKHPPNHAYMHHDRWRRCTSS